MTEPVQKTKRPRRTNQQLRAIEDQLYAILETEHPMTVRQVFYRAVCAKVVEKTETDYESTVGKALLRMRRSGRLPYAWITDATRWMRKPRSYNNMEEALAQTAKLYRRNLWVDQEINIEVWAEKDTIAGVLASVTEAWDVPLNVFRGFPSETYVYNVAQSIASSPFTTYVYYFGDHDPSGVAVDANAERKIRKFIPKVNFQFERVAVLPEQIEKWNLPTRPTKKTDSRAKHFVGESVEVDAIPPSQLRQLASDCIRRHVNDRLFLILRDVEKNERRILANLAKDAGLAGA